jgi:hypothetical protein
MKDELEGKKGGIWRYRGEEYERSWEKVAPFLLEKVCSWDPSQTKTG